MHCSFAPLFRESSARQSTNASPCASLVWLSLLLAVRVELRSWRALQWRLVSVHHSSSWAFSTTYPAEFLYGLSLLKVMSFNVNLTPLIAGGAHCASCCFTAPQLVSTTINHCGATVYRSHCRLSLIPFERSCGRDVRCHGIAFACSVVRRCHFRQRSQRCFLAYAFLTVIFVRHFRVSARTHYLAAAT